MTDVDHEMVEAARKVMRERYVEGRHQIGSALRTKDGKLFIGVHVEANCGRITLCGEAVAIGAAATGGDTDIEQIVAVTESGDIVPPCGMCRELISDYSPDAKVILDDGHGPYLVAVSSLLPHKFDGSRYPNRRNSETAQQGSELDAASRRQLP